MSAQKGETVVATAKVGCRYAQMSYSNKNSWLTRRVQIEHNIGDEQSGAEVVHNHNCITGKEREALKFKNCYSPYYLTAVENLKNLYPDNEEYQTAYQIAYKKANPTLEEDAPYPPCIFAVLDTWFEYSDTEISNSFQKFNKSMLTFENDLRVKVKTLKEWAQEEIDSKRKVLKQGAPVSQPSNATKKEDAKEPKQAGKDAVEEKRLLEIKKDIEPLYKERNALIKEVEGYWDDILIFKKGYQSKIKNISALVKSYISDWEKLLSDAALDLESEEYIAFNSTFSSIVENASAIGESMLNWEEVSDNALLTSSFLICKCGGVIEFLSSGQEHFLYCAKLLDQFVILMRKSASYLQELADNNCVFMGVTFEESNESVTTAIKSLNNIVSSFENVGQEFELDKDTLAMELRFITKGYNKEKSKKQAALIGMLLLTPIAIAGGAASATAGVAVSAGLFGYDAYNMMSQTPEEQNENISSDMVTAVNDTTSLVSSFVTLYIDGNWRASDTLKSISALGNPTIVVSFLSSLSGIFYTSEEDWVEEIEITVFSKYIAHIIKAKYDEEVTEVEPFDGKKMVIAKSKRDYSCESLKMVNWDELDGVVLGIDKDFSFNSDDSNRTSVNNAEQIRNAIEKNTNGELKQ